MYYQKKIITKVLSKSVSRTVRIDEMFKDYFDRQQPKDTMQSEEERAVELRTQTKRKEKISRLSH